MATRNVSVTAGVSITPTTTSTPPRGTINFGASGGSGGYTWSVSTNNSGSSITSAGVYTAGSTGGVTDAVTVTDFNGASASGTVTVTATATALTISPATAAVATGHGQTFTASGGSGGYTWSVSTNNSGGSITSAGVFTSGTTGGVTDTVKVTDSNGASATATVTVPAISSGSSSGGCGQGPGGMLSLVGLLLVGIVRRKR